VHRALLSHVRRATLVALALVPAALPAQIFKVGRRSEEPLLWASLSAGLFHSQSVIDGSTDSEWALNDALQWRGSLEYSLRGGSALGVVATHARVPFHYRGPGCTLGGDVAVPCSLDANMTVQSVWGTFHGGDGVGFHGVFEGGLGYTWYRSFESEDDQDPFADMSADRDFSFVLGTGFGYAPSRRLSFNVVRDWAWVRHQGEGLTNDDRTTTQQNTTRLGVRYGFGNRRAGL
jgi:hypothetical protein